MVCRSAVALCLALGGAAATAQESATYSTTQVTITAAGSHASSSNFATTAVLSQEVVHGAASACNTGFVIAG